MERPDQVDEDLSGEEVEDRRAVTDKVKLFKLPSFLKVTLNPPTSWCWTSK